MSKLTMTRRAFVAAGSLLLAGCGAKEEPAQTQPAEEAAAEQKPAEDAPAAEATSTGSAKDKRILVAFYSRADENYPGEWLEVGHTKVMAGYIAEALGADTYEIVPVEPYPEGYDDCCDQALEEQRNDARPAIAEALPDVSAYDVVFIGCPIWWGDEPMIVRTFLDGVDLSGKTIVPFTTHGGSGLGNVPANLQAAISGAQFLDGLAVTGTSVDDSHDEVVNWATGLMSA